MPDKPQTGAGPATGGATMIGHPSSATSSPATNGPASPAPSVAPPPATAASAASGGSASAAPSAVPVAHSGAMAAASLEGTVLSDRYRIIKKLGEGGMGSVYLAEHTTINKKLAIKVLSSEYSHKQDLVDRFLQEARAASMIEQENVVEITDFGHVPNGSVFFVMEFLNGEDLSRTIKTKGSLPWPRVKPIMLQICSALTAAHEAGIIHRDMKPENCYRIKRRSNQDFIKVLDFGIAKVTSDEGEGGRGLTRTGMIFGTPEYMSPEQAKGEKVDHRVDVYAVGVILYELLTGKVPFTADTFMGILTKHMFEAPPAPSSVAPDAEIPAQVEAIILKALQKDREYRFQSMRDLADAIEAVGTDSAAVSLVAERVAMPSTGETRFSDTGVPLSPSTIPPQQSSNRGVFIGLGVVLLLGLGGVAFALSGGDDPKPAASVASNETPAGDGAQAGAEAGAAEAGAAEAGAAEAGEGGSDGAAAVAGDGTPPPVEKAMITVSTPGIDGVILDGRDDSVIGKTNEPFSIPAGSDSLDLYVRAEGYEDLLLPVLPDADKTLNAEMTKLEEVSSGGRKGGGRTKGGRKGGKGKGGKGKGTKTPADTTPPPKPKDDPPPKPKDDGGKKGTSGGGSPDLKDPFGKH